MSSFFKLLVAGFALGSVFSMSTNALAQSGSVGNPAINRALSWTGFYVGLHIGSHWSDNDAVGVSAARSFANPLFPAGGGSVADALAASANQNRGQPHGGTGLAGGLQTGFNWQTGMVLVGVETDFQWLNGHRSGSEKFSQKLPNFNETYAGTVSASRSLDYLGTVRARAGVVPTRDLLLFVTGGLAYGKASVGYGIDAQESLGAANYPPISIVNSVSDVLAGWTVGGGGEYRLSSHWSLKAEYLYYDLGRLSFTQKWEQRNCAQAGCPVWGAANVDTSTHFSGSLARIGLNHKF